MGRDERALKMNEKCPLLPLRCLLPSSPPSPSRSEPATSSQPLIMACRTCLALVSSTLSQLTKHVFQICDRPCLSIFHD